MSSIWKHTHTGANGEQLYGEMCGSSMKYWTRHAWDAFGDAYSGPVEAQQEILDLWIENFTDESWVNDASAVKETP